MLAKVAGGRHEAPLRAPSFGGVFVLGQYMSISIAGGLRVAAAVFALAFSGAPVIARAGDPPAAFALVRAPAISNVSIAPDGKHLAALTSADGNAVTISVWNTGDLSKPSAVIAAGKVRILGVRFLKSDRLLIDTVQTFTQGDDRGHLGRSFVSDLQGKTWTSLLPDQRAKSSIDEYIAKFDNAVLLDSLPQDPTHVIVMDLRPRSRGDVLKVDLYSGETAKLENASDKFFSYRADLTGQIRARQSSDFEDGKLYVAQWFKDPTTGQWSEHFRNYAKDRENMDVVGFATDPNIVFVRSSKGRDKAGIYEYDLKQRKVTEPLFEHKVFEAGGVLIDRTPARLGQILGFTYQGPSTSIYWTDEKLAALDKGVRAALGVKTVAMPWTDPGSNAQVKIGVPSGANAMVISRSDDLKAMIVDKSGPHQPSEFYLLTESGQLSLLGKALPDLDLSTLGDTTLVEYAARDGLMIPAFLTKPPADKFGPGPYPTLIAPHGGPWARDALTWDVAGWTQYFASRGYAVLQPQFRGSDGWGQKLWRAGDGQWGQKMQDDKDDGAKWLIDQKIAAPDRIAMFGYSYGGYAALVAAIRPNGLYQCAVSGAPGSLASFKRETFNNRQLRELQRPTVEGLDAVAHAGEVKIPILLYRGDRDSNQAVSNGGEMKGVAADIKAAGKPYRAFEIKDMGHTYDTWTPAMAVQQLTEIESFLTKDCGPDGL
jgi:dipeptidyl aminopeptidase/acylaminoacyl peptidase